MKNGRLGFWTAAIAACLALTLISSPASAGEATPRSWGQLAFVPIYPSVYIDQRGRDLLLASTLSIRNTDLAHPIQVTSVRYYDSQGRLIRTLVEKAHPLDPLASIDFAVDEHDEKGSGTSFIVEWIAETEVHEPVVEAVMISTVLSQGLSFTTPGRVIRTLVGGNSQ